MESPWLQSSWYASTTSPPTALAPQAQPGTYGYQPDWPKSPPRSFIYEYTAFIQICQPDSKECKLMSAPTLCIEKIRKGPDWEKQTWNRIYEWQTHIPCQESKRNHAKFVQIVQYFTRHTGCPWQCRLAPEECNWSLKRGAASQRASKIKLVNCKKGILKHLATKKSPSHGIQMSFDPHRFLNPPFSPASLVQPPQTIRPILPAWRLLRNIPTSTKKIYLPFANLQWS